MEFISKQFLQIAITMGVGLLMGLFYDIYRLMRLRVAYRRFWAAFSDLLWWLFALVFVFGSLMWLTWGEVRFYLLLGLLAGFVLYRYYLHPFFERLARQTALACQKIKTGGSRLSPALAWLGKIISWPFWVLATLIYNFVAVVGKILSWLGRKSLYLISLFFPPPPPPPE